MNFLIGHSEVIDTLIELKRLHQLNLELLEQLDVTCSWLLDNGIKLPNENKFHSLLIKARALLIEIQTATPKFSYQKLADETLQGKRTDGDFTESGYRKKSHVSKSFLVLRVRVFWCVLLCFCVVQKGKKNGWISEID
jgi:hypothetical protein